MKKLLLALLFLPILCCPGPWAGLLEAQRQLVRPMQAEVGVLFAASGDLVGVYCDGLIDRVRVPTSVNMMGGVLIHSHPWEAGLSQQDINSATYQGLWRVIAVAPSAVYAGYRSPRGGWVETWQGVEYKYWERPTATGRK